MRSAPAMRTTSGSVVLSYEGAKDLANSILYAYQQANDIAKKQFLMTPIKVQKALMSGNLTSVQLRRLYDLPDGREVTLLHIIEHVYNQSIHEAYTVTKEFKDNVRPLLIKVLMANNAAIKPEYLLLFYGFK